MNEKARGSCSWNWRRVSKAVGAFGRSWVPCLSTAVVRSQRPSQGSTRTEKRLWKALKDFFFIVFLLFHGCFSLYPLYILISFLSFHVKKSRKDRSTLQRLSGGEAPRGEVAPEAQRGRVARDVDMERFQFSHIKLISHFLILWGIAIKVMFSQGRLGCEERRSTKTLFQLTEHRRFSSKSASKILKWGFGSGFLHLYHAADSASQLRINSFQDAARRDKSLLERCEVESFIYMHL